MWGSSLSLTPLSPAATNLVFNQLAEFLGGQATGDSLAKHLGDALADAPAALRLTDLECVQGHFHADAATRGNHTQMFQLLKSPSHRVRMHPQLHGEFAHARNQIADRQPSRLDIEDDVGDDLLEDRILGFGIDVKSHASPVLRRVTPI